MPLFITAVLKHNFAGPCALVYVWAGGCKDWEARAFQSRVMRGVSQISYPRFPRSSLAPQVSRVIIINAIIAIVIIIAVILATIGMLIKIRCNKIATHASYCLVTTYWHTQ